MAEAVDFFVHIPKSEGRTLLRIIERQYPPDSVLNLRNVAQADRVEMLEEMDPTIRIVAGHLHVGMTRHCPRPCRVFTILREPVERLLSLHSHLIRYEDSSGQDGDEGGELTLEMLARQQGSMQARLLAGYRMRDPVENAVLLREAKESLSSRLASFGLAECFDESLLFFNQDLGWEVQGYVRGSTPEERGGAPACGEGEMEMIRALSAVDVELYRFARGLFEERLAAQSPVFGMELAELRANIRAPRSRGRLRQAWDFLQRKLGPPRES